MKARIQIALWVAPSTQERFRALAEKEGLTVAGLLGDLVDELLEAERQSPASSKSARATRQERITTRLRPGDLAAIRQRAAARRLKPATYIAALVRAHLVDDPPLPPAELAVLERATAEVSAIERDFNQIARAINAGAVAPEGTAELIAQAVAAAQAVREAAKLYVRKAVAAWEAPLG